MRWLRWHRVLAGGVAVAAVAGVGWFVSVEIEASTVQARLISRYAQDLQYTVGEGESESIRFPQSGPYDLRLGYARLPAFSEALRSAGYGIERQARMSPEMERFVDLGGFAVYPEKTQTGVAIFDRNRDLVHSARHPERTFGTFESIPPLIVSALLFVENRELLDDLHPMRNPAVEWDRFAAAAVNVVARPIDPQGGQRFGGSTLATQIEKFRHSPEGRTYGVEDKLWQIASASVRAYQNGPDTTQSRHRIIVDYVNSTPLSARPGFGEVIGIGDGLWAWYGTDFDKAKAILAATPADPAEARKQAIVFKQVLSLLIAQRRPSYYLLSGRADLDELVDSHLRLLASEGIIDTDLRDRALAEPLVFRTDAPSPKDVSFVDRKAVNAMRSHLLSLLGVDTNYELDRLDLTVTTSYDTRAQAAVTPVLEKLTDPVAAKSFGLYGERLLVNKQQADDVIYSITLFERGDRFNYVRIQADNLDKPLDLNDGGKMDLGSTAKLRTLVTYLVIISQLYERYQPLSVKDLQQVAEDRNDPLSDWVADYLQKNRKASLQDILDAAMERRYSANPGEAFFTGRGLHVFANFDPKQNGRIMTLWEAMRYSVNMPFIRLMRDIIRFYTAEGPDQPSEILADADNPARQEYLERFADDEGSVYLNRFYRRYKGRTPDESLALLSSRARPTDYRQATIFRSVRPDASIAEFSAFMRKRLPDDRLDDTKLLRLYVGYGPEKFNLHDRGYIARLHPLELWLVRYLQKHPDAGRKEILAASTEERQAVYAWLFKSSRKRAADQRIRTLIDEDAYKLLHAEWRRHGYPFSSVVPSLATAIGSSADRPSALAELMGIIVNDGVRKPTVRIESLDFADGTPYETRFVRDDEGDERVFPREVAQTVRRALLDVVANGTARRVAGAFTDEHGRAIPIGGKTGTGDDLAGSSAARSKEVGRSAAFVFFIGDQYFGVVTAHTEGQSAKHFQFTSALPVQVLKALAPSLSPMIAGTPMEPVPSPVIGKAVAEASAPAR